MPVITRRLELKAEFVKRNLSISKVAERCGVSRGHLSRVLNGKADMDDKLARDIAMATGIPKASVWPEGNGV